MDTISHGSIFPQNSVVLIIFSIATRLFVLLTWSSKCAFYIGIYLFFDATQIDISLIYHKTLLSADS